MNNEKQTEAKKSPEALVKSSDLLCFPSGLRAVKRDACNCIPLVLCGGICLNCGVTVERDLSIEEALRHLKDIVKFLQKHPYYNVSPDKQILVMADGWEMFVT